MKKIITDVSGLALYHGEKPQLEKNYKLRKVKELNEQKKRKKGVKILSTDLKYLLKKFFLPKKLPLPIEI